MDTSNIPAANTSNATNLTDSTTSNGGDTTVITGTRNTSSSDTASDFINQSVDDELNRYGDSVYDSLFNSYTEEEHPFDVSVGDNSLNIKTTDGYTIDFSGKMEEWSIVGPDGTKTRIWGDPHVEESDGGHWDFTKQSTFLFGNTKATVETFEKDGAYYTKTVHLYNGKERLSITDVDKDKPVITSFGYDAKAHDAKTDDGDIYKLSDTNGSVDWKKS